VFWSESRSYLLAHAAAGGFFNGPLNIQRPHPTSLKSILKDAVLDHLLELARRLCSFFLPKQKELAKNGFCRYAVAHVENAAQP